MAVSNVKWWPMRIYPIHRLDLLHASETFLSWCSCARARKMGKYKKKRKEMLEVWDFSARLRKLKIIFFDGHLHRYRFSTSFSMIRGQIFLLVLPGFESQCAHLSSPQYFTCLLGLHGVQWIWGLVVVRLNWPGRPGYKKKKRGFVWLHCANMYFKCKGINFFVFFHAKYNLYSKNTCVDKQAKPIILMVNSDWRPWLLMVCPLYHQILA
jgi:hypothetical protein